MGEKGKVLVGVYTPQLRCGGIFMNIREGLIPTVLGTAVTATGYALKQKRGSNKMIANTVFGFGLAHIVLGAIDLVEHRR
jgi:formate/nitrite transporter FocA (FNT family)